MGAHAGENGEPSQVPELHNKGVAAGLNNQSNFLELVLWVLKHKQI